MNELDTRRRRAAYRANHRGTKEMDWLLGRYGEARLDTMSEAELADFERLIALPDPDLQTWIMSGEARTQNDLTDLVGRIRAFHGLSNADGVSPA
ncbi:MAG: succinate dehydrogenase assembly factor 2 [Hyphomicrobiaceae bacterium]|jgi:antitoxin CptB